MHDLLIAVLSTQEVPDPAAPKAIARALAKKMEPFWDDLPVPTHRRPIGAPLLVLGLQTSWQRGLLTALRPAVWKNGLGPRSVQAALKAAAAIPAETLADLLTCALDMPFLAEGDRVLEISSHNPRARWGGYNIGGAWGGHLAAAPLLKNLPWNPFKAGNALRVSDLPAAAARVLAGTSVRPCGHFGFEAPCSICRKAAINLLAIGKSLLDVDGTWIEETTFYDPFPLDLEYQGIPAGPDILRFAPSLFRSEVVAARVNCLRPDDILVAVDLHF